MKIKVDAAEWEKLLERVDELESHCNGEARRYYQAMNALDERMEAFFRHKTEVVMLKRDKEKIVAELKSKAVDNIFKEEK